MSEQVYGIDLGTTYSAIARVADMGTVQVVRNFEGEDTTPSAIFFEGGGNVVVGSEAKGAALADPDNACLLIKREMGTDFQVDYQGQVYTPEVLSAMILRTLVDAANSETGESVSKVVITVPAYFGTQEREATRQAGQIAGLEVLGIVTEPVAAALSIGMSPDQQEETIMVYDLGGGTFDTTVMKVGSGSVEVLGVDGNRKLGGADWDEELTQLMLRTFIQEVGEEGEGAEHDEEFMLDLRMKAEDAKKSLTKREKVPVRMTWETHKVNTEISREEFEAATRYLLDETIEIARRTVEQAKEKHPGLAIDKVMLVGGSSRMPMVAEALREQLGWEPLNTDFDLAVAKGAAIYGQAGAENILAADGEELAQDDAREEKYYLGGAQTLTVSNVLARGLGIEFVRSNGDEPYVGFFAHVNDPLPLSPDPIGARTVSDGQTSVNLALYEQAGERESEEVSDNRMLKEVLLPFAEPMPQGSPIDIVVTIDAEGLVRLHAEDPKSGNTVDMEVSVSQLDQQQVEEATQQVSALTLRS